MAKCVSCGKSVRFHISPHHICIPPKIHGVDSVSPSYAEQSDALCPVVKCEGDLFLPFVDNPGEVRSSRRPHTYREKRVASQVAGQNRRARELKAFGTLSWEAWLGLCGHYGHRCLRCDLPSERLHIDHIIPLSKGGPNTLRNVQPLCGKCNGRKRARFIDYRRRPSSAA